MGGFIRADVVTEVGAWGLWEQNAEGFGLPGEGTGQVRSHLTYAFGVYVSGIYPDTHTYMQVGASRDHEVRVVLQASLVFIS